MAARQKLFDRLPVTGEILRGSLLQRTIRNHASGCAKCASGEGHPLSVLTVSYPGGSTRQFSLRPERVAQVRRWLANYQKLKDVAAAAAGRFFERRCSVITRAFGSPKMPRTTGSGRKPGKQYASHSRRFREDRRTIQIAWQIPSPAGMHNPYAMHSFLELPHCKITHANSRRPYLYIPVKAAADA